MTHRNVKLNCYLQRSVSIASIALLAFTGFSPLSAWAAAHPKHYAVLKPHFKKAVKPTPSGRTAVKVSLAPTQMDLTLGKARILYLDRPASRISVSNPGVVSVFLISPREVQLTGKAIGVANLLLWSAHSGNRYTTIDLSVQRDVSDLAQKLQMLVPGISIVPVAAQNTVILTGTVESEEKAQLAYDLTKAFFADTSTTWTGTAAGSGLLTNPYAGMMGGYGANGLPGVGATGTQAGPGGFPLGAAPMGAGMGGGIGAGNGSSNMTMMQNSTSASSFSPGSAGFALSNTKIINLIKIAGQPSTKKELVQEKLRLIDPNIVLNVVPGQGNLEKAILTGRVKKASAVSKAVNLASIFYGQPGIKILTGPGGNRITDQMTQLTPSNTSTTATASGGSTLLGNLSNNILNGAVISDSSENVISMLEVEQHPEVKCSVKVLEVNKSAIDQYNANARLASDHLNLTTYAGTAGQPFASPTTTFFNQLTGNQAAEISAYAGKSFAAYVSGLIQNGKARILSEPTITSSSGEPASFLVGGEFPVPLSNVNGQITVQYKQFGILLNLLSTVTEQGTIHMQVSPEVSTLDPTAGVTISGFNIPGLKIRSSQSVLEMRDGDNFVLSGLYNENMVDTIGKTPILGQIPILGALFSSKNFQRSETELIIVIHPEIKYDMNLSNTEALQAAPNNKSAAADPITTAMRRNSSP